MVHKPKIYNDIGEIQCTACLLFYPQEQYIFRKNRGQYYRQCNICYRAKCKAWEDENPNRAKIIKKNYIIKNREKINQQKKEHQKELYHADPEKYCAKRRISTKTPEFKAYRRKYLKRGFEAGDIVYYHDLKYKIRQCTPRGYLIMRFGDCSLHVVARKHLIPQHKFIRKPF